MLPYLTEPGRGGVAPNTAHDGTSIRMSDPDHQSVSSFTAARDKACGLATIEP